MKQILHRYSLDAGLLILRIGIGLQLFLHGLPKITNPEKWGKLGSKMPVLNFESLQPFWGFMAAFAESGGGLLIALGLFFRPSNFLAAFTMLVAALYHWSEPDATYMSSSNAVELMIVSLGLFFTGPGKYSLDAVWFHKNITK